MAKIVIGGTEYELPVMKFKTLKKAFPIVMSVQETLDPMAMADAAIAVVSMAAIKKFPDMTPEWIEEELTAIEAKGLAEVMLELMIEAGLMTKEDAVALAGEALPGSPAPLLTAISTPSSPNLSQPDAAAEAGTQ